MDPIQKIKENFNESIVIQTQSVKSLAPAIAAAADVITNCLLGGHKILACGNGGSAIDAQHFCTKMLNQFEIERPELPAISLTADTSTITSIANDYQYAEIFSKQIRALGQSGDVLLALSSSGDAHNVIHAIDAARDRDMSIIALTGCDGGQIADLMVQQDIELRIPSWSVARIQEVQIMIIHSLCDLIDHYLLGQD